MAKFGSDSRKAVVSAYEIAATMDAPTIEAEHLLLALAGRAGTPASQALADAGLDRDGIVAALDAEFEQSLAGVGVAAGDFDLSASPRPDPSPRMGASAKLALERSAKIAAARLDRRVTPGHLLLGVLAAPAGTVPRALRQAGVDPAELTHRVDDAL